MYIYLNMGCKWKITVVLVLISFLSIVIACNTEYHTVNYYTIDCDESNEAIGTWVAAQSKSKRFIQDKNTCSKKPTEILSKNKYQSVMAKTLQPSKVAGSYVYYYYTAVHRVFWGLEDTVKAVLDGKTLNLVVNIDMNFFVLQQQTNNGTELTQRIVSSSNVTSLLRAKDSKVVSCESLYSYLSREGKKEEWSITFIHPSRSNAEFRFDQISGGIGGFWINKYFKNQPK